MLVEKVPFCGQRHSWESILGWDSRVLKSWGREDMGGDLSHGEREGWKEEPWQGHKASPTEGILVLRPGYDLRP